MARVARIVMPGYWHHVTQRGNHQQALFFCETDREFYLGQLRRYCGRYSVAIAGYCLMSNHVHLVVIPNSAVGLAQALGRTHVDYARRLNLLDQSTGHVWQNRYYSCLLDERHRWEALRYIELNPVRGGMAKRAEEWRWSSARAHVTGTDPTGLITWMGWRERWSPETWHEALETGIADAALLDRIREATRTGRPAAEKAFIEQLERSTGRKLQPQKRGRKPKIVSEDGQLKLGNS